MSACRWGGGEQRGGDEVDVQRVRGSDVSSRYLSYVQTAQRLRSVIERKIEPLDRDSELSDSLVIPAVFHPVPSPSTLRLKNAPMNSALKIP